MPNAFAYLMLWGWPVVTVILFARLPVPKAAAVSIIAGYLLLPTQPSINFPMLPAYNRELACTLPALIMAMIKSRAVQPGYGGAPNALLHDAGGWMPRLTLLRICVIALVVAPFFTVVMNGDSITIGGRFIPGLQLYDGASNVLGAAMMLIPFLIARKWLAHPQEHAMLLGVLCLAGLAYALPALYEIRMSPQLNRMVYGFFPHQWNQHIRGDGYRPLVFLEHGLRLGIFMTISILATLTYFRVRAGEKKSHILMAGIWLFGTLVLCKSVGALIIATVLAPVILFLGVRMQVLIAAVLAIMVLVYPMARSTGLLPVDTIRSGLTTVVSSGRIASLDFRLRNEDILLERARQRPLFGWGGWGRNMVYDESGRAVSVTDGKWVIYFGKDGWIGYLASFGLLTLPIILLAIRRRDTLTLASSGLSIVLIANLVDLLPNSGLTPVTWLMAGAIAGRLEFGRITDPNPDPGAQEALPATASPYRRQFPKAQPGRAVLQRGAVSDGAIRHTRTR